jgi:hypothetical protein
VRSSGGLSCRSFAAIPVPPQLHALADNLGNFLRTLATSEPIKDWSLTRLKEELIKIGANGGEQRPYSKVIRASKRFPGWNGEIA